MDQLTSNSTQKNARRLLELAGVSVLFSEYLAMLRIVVIVSMVLLVSLSPSAQATQQTNAIPKGQIVERMECLNDSSQSYALYLPSNYTPDRKWPILYALDPGARGKTPSSISRRRRKSMVGLWPDRTILAKIGRAHV